GRGVPGPKWSSARSGVMEITPSGATARGECGRGVPLAAGRIRIMVEPIARTIIQDQSRSPTQARAAKAGRRRTDLNAPDTLFVGSAGECRAAVESPAFANGSAFRPIGFVDVELPAAQGALGHIGDIHLLLGASGASKVVVCGDLTDLQFQSVVDGAIAGGCQVLWVPQPAEGTGVHPTTAWRQDHPLVQVV